MNLDENQKKTVGAWVEEGLKIADVQKRLSTEFGVSATYMEVRFLLDDLRLKPKDKELPPPPPAPPAPAKGEAIEPEVLPDAGVVPTDAAKVGSKVSVSVDQITRPGSVVSGSVTFSDGQTASWYLDQMGRLGLSAQTQGYRPSQPDLVAFQEMLQAELAKSGF